MGIQRNGKPSETAGRKATGLSFRASNLREGTGSGVTEQEYDMSTASLVNDVSIQSDKVQSVEAMPTRTIVFSSQKGGSGKTTLCGQLAVQAEKAGFGPVALIDTDPQGSLSDWWNARSEETPLFVRTSVDRLYDTVDELRGMGVKLVFVDTQPTVTDVIRDIIQCADMVVIPTRPSPHDLRAVGPTVDLVEQYRKPMVFAINCASRRARLTSEVAVALSQHGTVAPATIHNRVDFATSMINGKAVMEINPEGKSAAEIAAFWDYLGNRLQRLERDEGYQVFDATVQMTANSSEPAGAAAAAPGETNPGQRKAFASRPHKAFGQRHAGGAGAPSAAARHAFTE